MNEPIFLKRKWTISRFNTEKDWLIKSPYRVDQFNGNLILNEGITELFALFTGAVSVPFDNANAYLGVGDSTDAEDATQTGLQAVTNKFYQAQEAGYPIIVGNSITYRSVFGADDANFSWQEFTLANGNSDASINFNRKVIDQGSKTQGQIFTLDLTLSVS